MSTTDPQSLSPEIFQDLPDKTIEFYEAAFTAERAIVCVASLPRPRYRSALDVACATGMMSARLARRCDRVLGIDISEKELASARTRCKDLPNVEFARMTFPAERPDATFDALLFADVGYFWTQEDLRTVAGALIELLEPGGHLLVSHGTGDYPKFPITGDGVQDVFLEQAGLGRGLKHLFRRDFWLGHDVAEEVQAELNASNETCPVCGVPYFAYRLERHRQDVFERI